MALQPGIARAEEHARVSVFAAASLKTALDDIVTAYEEATGDEVTVSYAGSSVLARQISQGAPADLYISANIAWMDWLEGEGSIVPESRQAWLGNGLVLVAPRGVPIDVLADGEVDAGDDLKALLDMAAPLPARLAMALVEAVPAGIYGRAALENLGQWDGLSGHVVQTDNVRAALALVALGEVPLGIVYRSDAQAEPGVKVIGRFAPDTHPPIIYSMAAIKGYGKGTTGFARFLDSEAARATLKGQGFTLADGDGQ